MLLAGLRRTATLEASWPGNVYGGRSCGNLANPRSGVLARGLRRELPGPNVVACPANAEAAGTVTSTSTATTRCSIIAPHTRGDGCGVYSYSGACDFNTCVRTCAVSYSDDDCEYYDYSHYHPYYDDGARAFAFVCTRVAF